MSMMPSECSATRDRNWSSSWSVSRLAWGKRRQKSRRASLRWAELDSSVEREEEGRGEGERRGRREKGCFKHAWVPASPLHHLNNHPLYNSAPPLDWCSTCCYATQLYLANMHLHTSWYEAYYLSTSWGANNMWFAYWKHSSHTAAQVSYLVAVCDYTKNSCTRIFRIPCALC